VFPRLLRSTSKKRLFSELGGQPLGAGICAKLQVPQIGPPLAVNLLKSMIFLYFIVPVLDCFARLVSAWKSAFADMLSNAESPMRCDPE
jgi:hypothetical protein